MGQATRSAPWQFLSTWSTKAVRYGACLGLAAGLALAHGPAQARNLGEGAKAAAASQAAVVALTELPPEAQATERLIRAGGPFRHAKDGGVFGNRERLLPRQPRGFYREYTVRTPGARDRGARRIVCGGEVPTHPETCYYTDDHYASFRRIVQ